MAGSEGFANLFLALTLARTFSRAVKRKPEVLAIDRLRPGQSVFVRTAAPPASSAGGSKRRLS